MTAMVGAATTLTVTQNNSSENKTIATTLTSSSLLTKLPFTSSLAHCWVDHAPKIRTKLTDQDLKAGNANKNTLFLLHDSRVPTQVEFIYDFQLRDGYSRLAD